jgi:hypothetical protein
MLYVLLYIAIGVIGLVFHTGMEVSFDCGLSGAPPNVLQALAIIAMTITAVVVVVIWPYLLVRSLLAKRKP